MTTDMAKLVERLELRGREDFDGECAKAATAIRSLTERADKWEAMAVHNANLSLEADAKVAALTARVGELEAALAFYADEKNYDDNGAPFTLGHEHGQEYERLDTGDKARAIIANEQSQIEAK